MGKPDAASMQQPQAPVVNSNDVLGQAVAAAAAAVGAQVRLNAGVQGV